MNKCEECGGRFDYPGLHGCCVTRHPKPDMAQRIVLAIERDLNDRSGMGIASCDSDIQHDIREVWAKIINEELGMRQKDGATSPRFTFRCPECCPWIRKINKKKGG